MHFALMDYIHQGNFAGFLPPSLCPRLSDECCVCFHFDPSIHLHDSVVIILIVLISLSLFGPAVVGEDEEREESWSLFGAFTNRSRKDFCRYVYEMATRVRPHKHTTETRRWIPFLTHAEGLEFLSLHKSQAKTSCGHHQRTYVHHPSCFYLPFFKRIHLACVCAYKTCEHTHTCLPDVEPTAAPPNAHKAPFIRIQYYTLSAASSISASDKTH